MTIICYWFRNKLGIYACDPISVSTMVGYAVEIQILSSNRKSQPFSDSSCTIHKWLVDYIGIEGRSVGITGKIT
ncbi:MAG: hypothetical protein GX640_04525 [Fibrobacter sp.]|nr:hypothetical protein [Fibrobacter sp.]